MANETAILHKNLLPFLFNGTAAWKRICMTPSVKSKQFNLLIPKQKNDVLSSYNWCTTESKVCSLCTGTDKVFWFIFFFNIDQLKKFTAKTLQKYLGELLSLLPFPQIFRAIHPIGSKMKLLLSKQKFLCYRKTHCTCRNKAQHQFSFSLFL